MRLFRDLIYNNDPDYAPEKAVDDDLSTRWATDDGTTQVWLEVDLGEPTKINRVMISEALKRVQQFELQYKDGDKWQTCLQGSSIGSEYLKYFDTVTTRYVRLNILKAPVGPTISEFQLFSPVE